MRPFYTITILVLLANSSLGQVKKQPPGDDGLKAIMDSAVSHCAKIYLDTPHTVGLSVGIIYRSRSFAYNYGEWLKGSGKPASPDQFYNLGSVAKTFVATLLAEAVIEHKVRLNDDIRKYLPGRYPNLEWQGQPVTLLQLANHTSGLPGSPREFPEKLMDSIKLLPMPRQIALLNRYNADSLLKDLHHMQLQTKPGTVYHYNGQAMMVLILLLERVYHQPYDQLVSTYLRTHLGMMHSSPVLSTQDIRKFVQGYGDDDQAKGYANFTGFYGGPSMNSTLNDMLKYLKANLSERDAAIKLAHQVTFRDTDGTAIGLAWHHDKDYKGTPVIYHSGHTALGFNTLCLFYPGKGLGYILLVNEVVDQQRLIDLQKNIQVVLDRHFKQENKNLMP